MSKQQIVGMIIPDGTNQFFSMLAQLFQRELAKRRWGLVVINSDGSRARELNNVDMLMSMDVAGLVFISVGDSAEVFVKLADYKGPVLVLDREIPLENADVVLVDDALGVDLAIEYLSALGHRRIACVPGSINTEPGRQRFQSFNRSCDKYGIEIDEKLIFQGDFMFGSGTTAADRILSIPEYERPTAVFAANDLMAIGVMQRLQESGLRIPDDMSVVGYDDIAMSSWVFPRLTSVHQDPIEIARVGAGLLTERIDAGALNPNAALNQRVRVILPKLMLDHSWLRQKLQRNGPLLMDQMDQNRSAKRIRYHNGVVKPDRAWRGYRDIVGKQGIDEDDEYPHCAYVHFVYGGQGSQYAGLTAIQYWLFYYYNDWRTSHAGDWEHVVVVLKDSSDGQITSHRPYVCAYSAHHGGYRLDWRHVEKVYDDGNPESQGEQNPALHPVVYVANGSHANYFFGPSRYVTTTEVLGERVTSAKLPFGGEFTDFTTSRELGTSLFPEVKVVPPPINGEWEHEWRWLNFEGKWGSKGANPWDYISGLVRRRRAIGEAPDSLSQRENWGDPFTWIDFDCIDPLPPMDNWLTNEHYLRL